jgi:RecB family endonuclease NucS
MQQHSYEPELGSHYRPDLILKDARGRLVAVEVETEFPSESDYGVWQAVAYKHVAAAEFQQPCDQVRGVLVAPQIPESIKQKCKQLGIESIEVSRRIATD